MCMLSFIVYKPSGVVLPKLPPVDSPNSEFDVDTEIRMLPLSHRCNGLG